MTKSFDHLLRETLKAPPPEPPDGCLDAGVLAAWFEGTLDPIERAAAEAHAADCSRCQAVLAAMIRIEPPLESRPWWRSPAFGWLVPITVAAAALVVYVRMDRRPMESQVAQAPVVATPAATTPPSANQARAEQPSQDTAPGSIASTAPARASARPSGQTAKLEAMAKRAEHTQMPVQSKAAPPAGEATPRKDTAEAPLDELTRQRTASAAVPSPVPAPAAGQSGSAFRDATPPPPAPAPVAAPSAEDRKSVTATADRGSLAEAVVVNARSASDISRQPRVVVQTADGSTRWRILTPGSVERSNDAGATWETQSTGVSVILSSGAAPSKTVCWLVGKGGVVLLSADGRSWLRVPFPQAVDLVSVLATDASSATVTAVSGRTFTTVDGGKNWK